MIFTAIGLDPGGSTGWASYQAEVDIQDPNSIHHNWYTEKWNCGTFGPDAHHDALYTLLELSHTSEYHIICESFEYRNKSRPGLELISKEYIGVVNLFAQQRGLRLPGNYPQVHYQTAAQGKITPHSFIQKRHLENIGLWSSGRENRHAMDAYGHLLFWLINGQYKRYDLLKRLGK